MLKAVLTSVRRFPNTNFSGNLPYKRQMQLLGFCCDCEIRIFRHSVVHFDEIIAHCLQ